MDKWYTFDDVALLPQFNNIPSRTEPSLTTWLTKDATVRCPLLAANMDTVISPELATVLVDYGIKPIWHRFTGPSWIKQMCKDFPGSIVSCGLDEESINVAKECVNFKDASIILVDIAHGHDRRVMELIESLTRDNYDVIAGNVCTADGYRDLVNAGAVAVKVGIGPGYACTTRTVTGFGGPQFTAIQTIGEAANKLRVPVIADGGIRGSRECVLALAAGASTVMIGSLFAKTHEAAGRGKFRGQASEDFQDEYFGGLKAGTVAEGVSVEFEEDDLRPAKDVIEELLGGIRSGMTYGGARDIKELQRKAEFIEVTGNYINKT